MLLRPLSTEMYPLAEEYQLGSFVKTYKRYATLSGNVAFAGIFLLAFSLIEAIIVLASGSYSAVTLPLSLAEVYQGIFVLGKLLSVIRHEEMITPLHPKLSVEVYTEGFLYRKGRKIQAVRWEQLERVERQCTMSHRRKKKLPTRITYTFETPELPTLVLSAAVTDVDELGALAEHELTKRLLPEVQAEYQAGKTVFFSGLSLSRQSIRKPPRMSSFILAGLIVLVISAETFGVITSFHNSQQQSVSRFYPASISYSPHPTPQTGLPYSAETVYDAFLVAGINTSDVQYADGWYLYATYQPEGKLVMWEESYGVVLEIATFANPGEAKTDASDLLKHSAGYSVYTKSLCLFFYDSSISDAHRAAYMKIISRICK